MNPLWLKAGMPAVGTITIAGFAFKVTIFYVIVSIEAE